MTMVDVKIHYRLKPLYSGGSGSIYTCNYIDDFVGSKSNSDATALRSCCIFTYLLMIEFLCY